MRYISLGSFNPNLQKNFCTMYNILIISIHGSFTAIPFLTGIIDRLEKLDE